MTEQQSKFLEAADVLLTYSTAIKKAMDEQYGSGYHTGAVNGVMEALETMRRLRGTFDERAR